MKLSEYGFSLTKFEGWATPRYSDIIYLTPYHYIKDLPKINYGLGYNNKYLCSIIKTSDGFEIQPRSEYLVNINFKEDVSILRGIQQYLFQIADSVAPTMIEKDLLNSALNKMNYALK